MSAQTSFPTRDENTGIQLHFHIPRRPLTSYKAAAAYALVEVGGYGKIVYRKKR